MMPGVLFPSKPHGFALTYLICLTCLYTGMSSFLIHGRAAPLTERCVCLPSKACRISININTFNLLKNNTGNRLAQHIEITIMSCVNCSV